MRRPAPTYYSIEPGPRPVAVRLNGPTRNTPRREVPLPRIVGLAISAGLSVVGWAALSGIGALIVQALS